MMKESAALFGTVRRLFWVIGCAMAMLAASIAQAAILRVDPASPTNGFGTNPDWSDAYHSLDDAIGDAQQGDEIHVAGGTYKPANQSSTFKLKTGVSIQGGYRGYSPVSFPGQTPDDRVEISILSGDLAGDDDPADPSSLNDNAWGVVFIPDDVQPPSVPLGTPFEDRANLDGFEITAAHGYGGVRTDQHGVSAIIRKCKIHHNVATNVGSSIGGGVYVRGDAVLVLRQCEIYENHANGEGGAIGVVGEARVLDCWIHDNTAGGDGGGIKCLINTGAALTVIGCTIEGNQAGAVYPSASGGGLSCKSSGGTITLINSKFIGNSAGEWGGAIEIALGDVMLEMINCTVSGNSVTIAGSAGGGLYFANGSSLSGSVTNSIFWDNTAASDPEISVASGTLSVTYSDVEQTSGTYPGTGNVNSNPLFEDASAGDYRLQCGSLCINAGLTSAVPVDEHDVNEDDNSDPTEITPDLDLLTRIVGANVDMGAYEKQAAYCAADIDEDGTVGVPDLLAVINAWGACGSPCPTDVGPLPCIDGSVGVEDLLVVINSWGPCSSVGGQMPESIADCFDVYCAGLSGDAWEQCLTKCLETVCSQTPPPDGCQ